MTQRPPTVLVPGTLCDAALWNDVTVPTGARVLDAVRGATLAQAAGRVMDAVPDGRPFHLVGFSLGAIVAFEVLRLAPQRLARLTLLSANPRAPTPAQLNVWADHEREIRAGRFEPLIDALSVGPHRAALLAMARRVGPQAHLEQLGLLRARPDSRPDLARYQGALSVLVGQDDPVTPPHLADEVRAVNPRAEVTRVPGAGHYLPLDAPQALTAALMGVPCA